MNLNYNPWKMKCSSSSSYVDDHRLTIKKPAMFSLCCLKSSAPHKQNVISLYFAARSN